MIINVLEVISGDDDGIPIYCRNPANDQPIDVSLFTEFICTVRDKKKRILIQKKFTVGEIAFVTDGTDGELNVILSKRDTHNIKEGVYRYDLQVTDASNVTTTPVKSWIIIEEDVT